MLGLLFITVAGFTVVSCVWKVFIYFCPGFEKVLRFTILAFLWGREFPLGWVKLDLCPEFRFGKFPLAIFCGNNPPETFASSSSDVKSTRRGSLGSINTFLQVVAMFGRLEVISIWHLDVSEELEAFILGGNLVSDTESWNVPGGCLCFLISVIGGTRDIFRPTSLASGAAAGKLYWDVTVSGTSGWSRSRFRFFRQRGQRTSLFLHPRSIEERG